MEEGLKLVEVEHLADRSCPTLSGGEKQRVLPARVPAQIREKPANPARYLFLDEPTAGLELAHRHPTLQTARLFAAQETAVLVALHDLNSAVRYADRITILRGGEKYAFDTPKKV